MISALHSPVIQETTSPTFMVPPFGRSVGVTPSGTVLERLADRQPLDRATVALPLGAAVAHRRLRSGHTLALAALHKAPVLLVRHGATFRSGRCRQRSGLC